MIYVKEFYEAWVMIEVIKQLDINYSFGENVVVFF